MTYTLCIFVGFFHYYSCMDKHCITFEVRFSQNTMNNDILGGIPKVVRLKVKLSILCQLSTEINEELAV